jgi:hypothetical protein
MTINHPPAEPDLNSFGQVQFMSMNGKSSREQGFWTPPPGFAEIRVKAAFRRRSEAGA